MTERRMSEHSRRNVRGATSNKTAGRIPNEVWEEYAATLKVNGETITRDLTNYIEWTLGLPGAVAPRRLVNPKDRPR